MKRLASCLFSLVLFCTVDAQKKSVMEIMDDSLWHAIQVFENQLKINLENKTVEQKDIELLVNYFERNFQDSVQTSDFFIPYTATKAHALQNIRKQLQDIVGEKNCEVKFVSWDGWDGNSPSTMLRLDILHHAYRDQVMLIIDTEGKIHCLFSLDSKFDSSKETTDNNLTKTE
jgi:L-lysine 2,3-aminomutase